MLFNGPGAAIAESDFGQVRGPRPLAAGPRIARSHGAHACSSPLRHSSTAGPSSCLSASVCPWAPCAAASPWPRRAFSPSPRCTTWTSIRSCPWPCTAVSCCKAHTKRRGQGTRLFAARRRRLMPPFASFQVDCPAFVPTGRGRPCLCRDIHLARCRYEQRVAVSGFSRAWSECNVFFLSLSLFALSPLLPRFPPPFPTQACTAESPWRGCSIGQTLCCRGARSQRTFLARSLSQRCWLLAAAPTWPTLQTRRGWQMQCGRGRSGAGPARRKFSPLLSRRPPSQRRQRACRDNHRGRGQPHHSVDVCERGTACRPALCLYAFGGTTPWRPSHRPDTLLTFYSCRPWSPARPLSTAQCQSLQHRRAWRQPSARTFGRTDDGAWRSSRALVQEGRQSRRGVGLFILV